MPADQNRPASRGSALSLVALFCMAALVSGLLITNHFSQRSLRQANARLFQQNLDDASRTISYFLSERENNIRALARSTAVTAYFANRAMGMTMAYGLRASLNNIDRLFEERVGNSLLDTSTIYSHLLLLDTDAKVLSVWPKSTPPPDQALPNTLEAPRPMMVRSHGNGSISLTCPVAQNDQAVGFVRGWIRYQTLVDYLLRNISGHLIIVGDQDVVFKSQSSQQLPSSLVRSLIEDPIPEIRRAAHRQTDNSDSTSPYTIFQSAVPGYAITLVVLESKETAGQTVHQLVFMITLSLLSAGVFAAATFILRMGSKRMVLETSLAESTKREKAISEKKEEMELVLEAAQLGTWSWNIPTGQIEFNERYWSMLGYAKGEMPERYETWKELLHPGDAAYVIPLLESHLNGLTPFFSTEYRLRHRAGHWVWVHDSGKMLLRDSDHKPLRAFGIHLDITERKESGRLLAMAKEESDAIIRNFLDTLIVINTDLKVIRANHATCALLGYREEELIGIDVAHLFHDTRAHVHAVFGFYATKGQSSPTEELRNIELCYRHKDGSRLPMSFNVSLLKDDEGTITGSVAGAKDVSHLRLALDKIAQQKEYIETLFDILPEGLLALSPAQTIARRNRAYDLLLWIWADRLGISEAACSAQLVDKIILGQAENEIFTVCLQQGETIGHFRCHSVFITVLEGVASVVVIEDITKQRLAEEERRLLATVIEQTSDSVFIVGTDEIIQYVNPAAAHNSGFSTEELIGSSPPIYSSDLMDPGVIAGIRQTIAEGQPWHGPFRSRRKDGSIIEEDASISPVRNEEGLVAHIVGVKRDITEKVHLQRQLLQAQKLEAIGQLAAGIAHEINTPMQYIQNNVTFFEQSFNDLHQLLIDIAQADPAALPDNLAAQLASLDLDFILEEIPTSIRETLDGIERVVKIVLAMKEFSHPGRSDKAPADLNHNLDNTLIVCRNEWKYVAEMVTDFAPDLPPVPCFPDRLNQAILNLVINASHAVQERKAQNPEPGRITVSTRQDGDWVEIRVGDNGSGIPKDIQQRIFEPFFTTKQVGKGTGQGLTIVHDTIVKKHGGTIDFTTMPGEGTTFIIRLPLIQAREEASD